MSTANVYEEVLNLFLPGDCYVASLPVNNHLCRKQIVARNRESAVFVPAGLFQNTLFEDERIATRGLSAILSATGRAVSVPASLFRMYVEMAFKSLKINMYDRELIRSRENKYYLSSNEILHIEDMPLSIYLIKKIVDVANMLGEYFIQIELENDVLKARIGKVVVALASATLVNAERVTCDDEVRNWADIKPKTKSTGGYTFFNW